MRDMRARKVCWIRGVAMATALLALLTGFCLFDQDHNGAAGHLTRPDPCLGMLAVSLAIEPLVGPLAFGWALDLRVAAARTLSLHIPDPPPKPASVL